MESQKGLKWRKPHLKPIETLTQRSPEEEEEEALSPSARLFHEPNFNVYVVAIMGCTTRIQPHIVKANLLHTLLNHPRFSSLQVTDEKNKKEMKWVRTEVDLGKHVIVPEIDERILDSSTADNFIEDYISNLTKTTINQSQPLWDLHLLNIKTTEAESVGVFRIHHSLGDGTSLMSLLLACTRQISDPQALPTIPTMTKKKSKRQHEIENCSGFWRYVMAAWWFCTLLWNTIVDVSMFLATVLFLKDTETPIKGKPGIEFTPRRFVWRTVSLDDIKLVKNAMNATVNDVALGVTQAGLSQYLNRKYGENKKSEETTQCKSNIPNNIRLRATLLINLRPAAGIQALADMMEKNSEAKWGNWIGYVLLPFTIGLRDDPLDYVREAKATADRKKHSLEAIFTFYIAEIFLKLFGIKRASGLSHSTICHTTMSFSSLIGPQEEIQFYGHPMAYLAPSSFNLPHASMINFQSYTNKMTIVLSVDEGTIPDAHQLIDDIVESLKLIKNAALSRGARL